MVRNEDKHKSFARLHTNGRRRKILKLGKFKLFKLCIICREMCHFLTIVVPNIWSVTPSRGMRKILND